MPNYGSLKNLAMSMGRTLFGFNINSNQKVLVVVSKKTDSLKLATQNLKNVELILASNLNTFSLLKTKQIVLSSLSINDIKETYCD